MPGSPSERISRIRPHSARVHGGPLRRHAPRLVARWQALGRRGQALVEFAVVLPVLLLLFGSVLDLGRAFYAHITLENAARSGAFAASVQPDSYIAGAPCTPGNATTNAITCAVTNESAGSFISISPSEIQVTCVTTSGTAVGCPKTPQPGVRSQVTVVGRFTPLMPFISAVLGSSVPMTSAVAMDQQAVPSPVVELPTQSPIPTPGPTPTPIPTPTPSTSPTPVPSPTPTLPPCSSATIPVPDLVTGYTGPGSTETVAEARTEWMTAGFTGHFSPASGVNTKIVKSQNVAAGSCHDPTISISVSYQ